MSDFLSITSERSSARTPADVLSRRDAARLQRSIDNANIPAKFTNWYWSNLSPYDGDVEDYVHGWVDRFASGHIVEKTGVGMIFYGKPGHGKTGLAATVVQEALRAATPASWGKTWAKPYQPSRGAYMAPYRAFPKLTQRQFNDATSEDEDALLKDIVGERTRDTAIRLLVLDDVGKEHRTSSGWAVGFFEDLIRERYYEGWPTIITTNLYPGEWQATYGDSCESFMHEAFTHHHVASPDGDRRKK